MDDTLARLTEVFRDVFEDDELVITRVTTARDIPAWDSVVHVSLMVRVEKAFKVRFSSSEVAALQSVGELVDLLVSKARS